jgi:hypothetical protein
MFRSHRCFFLLSPLFCFRTLHTLLLTIWLLPGDLVLVWNIPNLDIQPLGNIFGLGGSLTLLCRIVQAAAVPYCNSNYTTHNSEVSALTTAGDFRITFSSRDHLHGSVSLNPPRAGVPPAYPYQLFFPAAASAPRALRPEQAASPYNAARQIICGHRSALRSTKNKNSQEYFPGVRFHSRYFCSGPRPDKLLVGDTRILGGSWRTEALKSHLGAQN